MSLFSLQWHSPQWLWLLLTLLIPLFIHLARRSHPRVITFAAAQWLRARRQRRLNRVYLRDKLLLLLRLLILSLLVALLAQPFVVRTDAAVENMLLVDPRIEQVALEGFLEQNTTFDDVRWLQPEPSAISSPRPPGSELWSTLSQLAAQAEYRHAHILIKDTENPSGHSALRVSPHWQWHTLAMRNPDTSTALPRIAIAGKAPEWLQPVVEEVSTSLGTDITVQQLGVQIRTVPEDVDWLIYDGAGELPEDLRTFVSRGGLLITNAGVTNKGMPEFIRLAGEPAAETLAFGRGSWLRYIADWHSTAFFHRNDLPQQLWQQWHSLDWSLQSHNRSQWVGNDIPGIAVMETEVEHTSERSLENVLLMLLALLIFIERAAALGRKAPLLSATAPGKDSAHAR